MTLTEAQDTVQEYAPSSYYTENYRGWESDYLPALCEMLAAVPPARALDVGPGWGTMMVWLAGQGWKVTVAEVVRIGAHMTYEFLDKVRAQWVALDICEKPLLGQQFELITMTQVLPHLKWHPLAAVQNCREMLAEGGTYTASVLDAKHYVDKVQSPYGTDWQAVPHYGCGLASEDPVIVMYTEDSFRELLEEVFDDVTISHPDGCTTLIGVCRAKQGD